jgi:hypothetical protein
MSFASWPCRERFSLFEDAPGGQEPRHNYSCLSDWPHGHNPPSKAKTAFYDSLINMEYTVEQKPGWVKTRNHSDNLTERAA